jgi:hypothetical protein
LSAEVLALNTFPRSKFSAILTTALASRNH